MKKRLIAVAMSACFAVTMMSGCSKDDMDISGDGEITLGDYSNFEVYEAEVEVTDEYWESTLSSILSSASTTETVTEGTVEEGDTINIDYVGTINDGFEFDGGTAEDTTITLGSSGYIDGFDAGLYGAEIGSTVELDLTFPDDYTMTTTDADGNEIDLAGLPVVFTVTINSRTDTITPEFTDDFVTENYGYYGYSTAEEFEEYVRNQIYISNVISVIWDDFIDTCTVDKYDDSEVESYVAYIEEQYESQYESYYGVDVDTYLSAAGVDRDEWDASNLESAQAAIKEKMAYLAIAKEQNLIPTQEEYEKEAQVYVDANGFESLEALEEQYTKDEVLYAVITARVQEYLADNATVLEGERPTEESTEEDTTAVTEDDATDASVEESAE